MKQAMSGSIFEEKVRAFRLMQIDEMIRCGKFPNATSIAKKTEVSPRTIHRDIEFLKDFYNAPIEYDARQRGYYYTEKNFFVKSIMLTEGELFSVTLFDQLLEQYRNTPLETNLRNIFRKLVEIMPRQITVDSSFLGSKLTFIADHGGVISPDIFETIFTALKSLKTVSFEYRSLSKTEYTKRLVDPYHAICQKGNWYIIGFCHERQEPRLFSLSRIRNAKETKPGFIIPDDFNPHDYFDKEMGVWASEKKSYSVEFVIDKEIGTYAVDHIWHKSQELKKRKDGSVHVKFTTTQISEVLRWILGQGHTVKVLRPPELVMMVKEEVERIREMYEKA